MSRNPNPKSILNQLGNDQHRPEKLKAFFYGAPGTGKTYLVGTAPNVLLLDVDGGATTVRDHPNVTVFRIRTWQDLDNALFTLMNTDHPFDTVAIDTLTTLQEVVATEVDLMSAIDADTDPRRHYMKMAAMMRHKLVLFAQLDMHVIWTAHLREASPEASVDIEEGKYLYLPDIQPSVQRVALALPDVIGRTFLKDIGGGEYKHAVLFGPDGRSVSKERNFGLPKEGTGLTIPKLIKQVTNEKEKK